MIDCHTIIDFRLDPKAVVRVGPAVVVGAPPSPPLPPLPSPILGQEPLESGWGRLRGGRSRASFPLPSPFPTLNASVGPAPGRRTYMP